MIRVYPAIRVGQKSVGADIVKFIGALIRGGYRNRRREPGGEPDARLPFKGDVAALDHDPGIELATAEDTAIPTIAILEPSEYREPDHSLIKHDEPP
ncbi:MAG TPA: hypothetical protein PK179_08260 [Spirochaetales bacterium]|nr:hypothetical protein [Spirochaetales bacterium]HPM72526.1 hypothetical protein [Spirochaetales bacterium]